MNKKLSLSEKDLVRRYLIWCYKTTKESLDRVDRYFTQIIVDDFMLKDLKKAKEYKPSSCNEVYRAKVDDFEAYMDKKEKNVLSKKYKDIKSKELDAEYLYLQNRFKAIEKAIGAFLGKTELKNIKELYESEMTSRILQSREHT